MARVGDEPLLPLVALRHRAHKAAGQNADDDRGQNVSNQGNQDALEYEVMEQIKLSSAVQEGDSRILLFLNHHIAEILDKSDLSVFAERCPDIFSRSLLIDHVYFRHVRIHHFSVPCKERGKETAFIQNLLRHVLRQPRRALFRDHRERSPVLREDGEGGVGLLHYRAVV